MAKAFAAQGDMTQKKSSFTELAHRIDTSRTRTAQRDIEMWEAYHR